MLHCNSSLQFFQRGIYIFQLVMKLPQNLFGYVLKGLSHIALLVKSLPVNVGNIRGVDLIPWVGKIPWMRTWQPTPVFLPGESHGQRSLAGCSPWGCREMNITEAT